MVSRAEAAKVAEDYINRVYNKYGKTIEGGAALSAALVSACHDLLKAQEALDRARRVRGMDYEVPVPFQVQRPADSSRGSSDEEQGVSEGEGPEGQRTRHTVDPVREHPFDLDLEGEINCPNCNNPMDARGFDETGDFTFYSCPNRWCGYVEDR